MKKKITVLYVDQALAFGGSLVVVGYLINSVDSEEFSPVFIGELDVEAMTHIVRRDIPMYEVNKVINYAKWTEISSKVKKIPSKVLRKFIIYLLSVSCGLLNTVYTVRVALLILKERVDIVHVNNGMYNIEPIIASVILRRKCVVHFHGVEKPGLFQRMIMNKVAKFIVISEYVKERLLANGMPSRNMVVIHNPVQKKPINTVDVEAVRKKFCLAPGDRVFGIVGRVVRWKGHVEFLNAAEIVLNTVPASKVLIVGDYSDGDVLYQEEITRIIDRSVYRDRIIFAGFVKNVQNFYQLMDVCVHTSIEPEPFGLVITEAMAYGVPVVASDRGAPKEIINHGVTGFIVNPEDADKLAETIANLLLDEKLHNKIAEAAYQHVMQVYNIENFKKDMQAIYTQALYAK